MSKYPIDHCPDVELTKMPNDDVKTYDGHVLRLGSVVYFRFTPVRAAAQCVVVSDRAIRHNGGHRVIVVGSRIYPVPMNPYDLVIEPDIWWEFWQKRYEPPTNGSYHNNGDQTRHRGSGTNRTSRTR